MHGEAELAKREVLAVPEGFTRPPAIWTVNRCGRSIRIVTSRTFVRKAGIREGGGGGPLLDDSAWCSIWFGELPEPPGPLFPNLAAPKFSHSIVICSANLKCRE